MQQTKSYTEPGKRRHWRMEPSKMSSGKAVLDLYVVTCLSKQNKKLTGLHWCTRPW